MPAGMRGGYHAVSLAGADMSMSLSKGIQVMLGKETEYVENIDKPVPAETIESILRLDKDKISLNWSSTLNFNIRISVFSFTY